MEVIDKTVEVSEMSISINLVKYMYMYDNLPIIHLLRSISAFVQACLKMIKQYPSQYGTKFLTYTQLAINITILDIRLLNKMFPHEIYRSLVCDDLYENINHIFVTIQTIAQAFHIDEEERININQLLMQLLRKDITPLWQTYLRFHMNMPHESASEYIFIALLTIYRKMYEHDVPYLNQFYTHALHMDKYELFLAELTVLQHIHLSH